MKSVKVIILNNLPLESGIGHYAHLLFESMKPDSELLNFPNKPDLLNGSFDGRVVDPLTNSRIINVLTRQIVNRTTIRYIDEFDGVVHYAGHLMFPIGNYTARNRIGTFHDLIPLEYSESGFITSLHLRRNLRAMLDIPNVIVFTEWMRNKLIENHVYNGRIYVVPHGYAKWFEKVEFDNTHKVFPKKEGERYILSVSTDQPRKNLKILPSVMKTLGAGYKLVRIGPMVSDSITFNRLSPKQLVQAYRSCDVLIFPSLDEGFGTPMIEAFAAGIPVAASDIAIFREIGGDAVEYFDPNNPEEAAEAIRRIMADRERYVKKSLERAKLYSPELFTHRMHKVYNSII